MEKLLLRPEEAAQVLGVARSRLYVMLNRGEIPYVLVGTSAASPPTR